MNKTFRPQETRPAGYVFTIPARVRHLRDNKPSRPFLLLARSDGPELAPLALMTTKSTESGYGATLYELADRRGRQPLPGQQRSYVDLSSLLFRRAEALRHSELHHGRHMTAVRERLKIALGIGTGVGRGVPGTSIRGHLVRLSGPIAEMYDFQFGIVLTEHGYSAARRLQSLVPVVDVRTFLASGETLGDFSPEAGDVLPALSEAWVRQLPSGWVAPVIDTVRLSSFSERWEASTRRDTWLEGQIEYVFPYPVDAATLERVESALSARFDLS
jgi:hypothetical protein